MSRLIEANTILAKEIIGRYPKARSATIPLLHLSQQQNGYVTNDAIAHVAELVGATSGLGFLMLRAQGSADLTTVLAACLAIVERLFGARDL